MKDRTDYLRRWRQANKYARNRCRMERYHANKKVELDRAEKWHRENPQKALSKGRKFRSKPEYKEYHRLRMQKYRNGNRGRIRSIAHKRHATKLGVTIDVDGITEWMTLVKSKPTFTCTYCKKEFSTDHQLHFDHIVPLSRGGWHCIENLCASCPRCNYSKGSRLLSEWHNKPQTTI